MHLTDRSSEKWTHWSAEPLPYICNIQKYFPTAPICTNKDGHLILIPIIQWDEIPTSETRPLIVKMLVLFKEEPLWNSH